MDNEELIIKLIERYKEILSEVQEQLLLAKGSHRLMLIYQVSFLENMIIELSQEN